MVQISNDLYDLSFDEDKNRVYFTMKGFCPSTDNLPTLANEWKDICDKAEPGFTILEDFSTLKTMPPEVYKLVVKLHLSLIRTELGKIAIMAPRKSDALTQVRDITKLAILPFSVFETVNTAEKWLNDSIPIRRQMYYAV